MDRDQLTAMVSPESVVEYVARNAPAAREVLRDHGHGEESVRVAMHRGRRIVIYTRYRILVDDVPYDLPLNVGNDGQVHYHAIPNTEFSSAVDVVRRAIDAFPYDFGRPTDPPHHHTHGEES